MAFLFHMFQIICQIPSRGYAGKKPYPEWISFEKENDTY